MTLQQDFNIAELSILGMALKYEGALVCRVLGSISSCVGFVVLCGAQASSASRPTCCKS